jgi:hypothetical protein
MGFPVNSTGPPILAETSQSTLRKQPVATLTSIKPVIYTLND